MWKRRKFLLNSVKLNPFAIISFLVFAFAGAAEITYNDTLIYHTQAIRWIQEYSVIPGLGNLHTRFAFNSHMFTTLAGMTFEWRGVLFYPLNSLLLIAVTLIFTNEMLSSLNKKSILKGCILIIVLCVILILYPFWLSTPSPDIAIALMTLLSFFFFVEYLIKKRPTLFYVLITLTLTAITYKISTVFLLLLPVYAMIYTLTNKTVDVNKRRLFFISGILFLIVLLPFFLRNVIISGYLIYPFPKIDFFAVDWKIPAETALFDIDYINAWAKVPRAEVDEVLAMSFHEWFPLWWYKKSLPFKLILLGTLFSIVPAVYLLVRRNWHGFFLLFVIWINLIFWFITAPDPRFIHGILILAFAISFTFVLQKFSLASNILSHKLLKLIVMAMMIGSIFTIKDNKSLLFKEHFFIPKPYPRGKQKIVNGINFNYRIPSLDNQCYNAPLPCAEKIVPSLELRGSDLSQGFRIATK